MWKTSLLLLVMLALPMAGAQSDYNTLESKVRSFVEPDNALIVEGKHASLTEKATLAYVQERYPGLAGIERVKEQDVYPDLLTGRTVIVLGGPMQSPLASMLLGNPSLQKDEHATALGIATFLQGTQKALIVSDNAGYHNLPQTAASKSPLNSFMPTSMVPAAATLAAAALLWSWQFMAKLLRRIFSFALATKLMKLVRKRTITDKFRGYTLLGVRFKLREWIAILVAASVFAVSLGYLYLSPSVDVIYFFALTVLVNTVVFSLRHLLRLFLDARHSLHTEYKLWPYGVVITAFSAWLGNLFSMAGYIASEKENPHEGKHAFLVNVMTFLAAVSFYILNLLSPSLFFQMAMLLSLSITFIQMLPFSPFSGRRIFRWKKSAWFLFFIPLSIAYIAMNLII